eukprot:TRINITY_DN847_c2_g1_i1.p1 TRINITY_DN847_c2_g1~~TRINITY_DN847_c2_g1_i1.p1  ORF type:complete len:361 (+),score=63.95 TRINITY_DN847_c2_g1_i1:53-1135(+)
MYTVQQLNAILESGWSSDKTIVIGNESCDMDSVVSSLVQAVILQTDNPDSLIVPVLNVEREDLPLRTEAFFALKEFGVDVDKLIFAPEIDLANSKHVVLVDHNEPCPAQGFLSNKIVQIVDHHVDGNKFTELPAEKRIIELVGSASSLVARGAIQKCSGADTPAFDSSLSSLLLGTILIDTMNHDPEVKKSTAVDKEVASQLSTMYDAGRYPTPGDLYAKLSQVKFDSSSLTIAMHLRKDYKSFCFNDHKLGVAAVLESLSDLYKRGDFEQEIKAFYKSRSLDTLLIMTLTVDGDTVTRTASIYPPSSPLVEEFTSGSISSLVGFTAANYIPELPCFDQKDTSVSRKKLTPLISKFFEGN